MAGRIYRAASNGDPANAIVYSNDGTGWVHIQSLWRKATINDIVGSSESSNPWVTDGWVKLKSVWRYDGSTWWQVFSGFDLPTAIQPLPNLVDASGDNTYIDTTETIYLNRGGWSEEPNYYKLEIQKGDNYLNSPWTTIESVELDENSTENDFISYKIRRVDAVDTSDASNTSSNFASRFRGKVTAITPGTLEGIYYTSTIVPHLQILGTVTSARSFANGSAEIIWDLVFDGPTETGTGAINTVTSSHVNGGYIELTNSLTGETFGTYTVANNSDVNTKFTLPAGTIPACLSGDCPEYNVTVVLYARDTYKFETDPFNRTIISMSGDVSITPPQAPPTIGSVAINESDLNNQGGLAVGCSFSVDYFNDLNTEGATWSYKLYKENDDFIPPTPTLMESNDTGIFDYLGSQHVGSSFYVVVTATTDWGVATATTPSYVLYDYPTLSTIAIAAGPTLNGTTRIALFYYNYPKKVTVSWDDIDNTTQELNTIYIYPTNETGLINPSYVYTTPGTKTIQVEVDPRPDYATYGQTLKTKDIVLETAPLQFSISSFTKGYPDYGQSYDLRPLVASWDLSDGAETYEYKIQGSNDQATWTTLRDYTLTGNSGSDNFISVSLTLYTYYRIYVKAFSTSGTYETSATNDGFEATGTSPGIPTSIVVTPGSTSASVSYSNTLNKGSNSLSGIQYKLGTSTDPEASNVPWSSVIAYSPFTITTVAGQSYTLYMRSVNYDGLFSESTTGTTFTSLSKPVNTSAPVLSQPSYSSSELSVTSGSWSTPTDSYIYQWYNADYINPVRTITKSATTDTYQATLGQDYYVLVTAKNSGISSDPAYSNNLVASAVPSAPVFLSASNITYTTALITWFEPSSNGQPIDYYQWSLNGTTWNTSGISYNNATSQWEYNFSDSISSTRSKTFYVRAHNAIGFSSASSVSFSLLSTSAPDAPTIANRIDVGTSRPYNDGSVIVSWNPPINNGGYDVTKYKIEYSYSDNPNTWYTLSDTLTGTSVTSSPWGSGLNVRFRVSAFNQIGWSAVSAASSYLTVTTVPQAPTISFVDDISGSGGVSVSFSANATGGKSISSYSVSTNGGGGTGSSGTSSPLSITGLTNGTEYTAYATATNDNGTSALSAGVTGMPFGDTSVSSSNVTDVDFSLSWSTSGATNYYVDVYRTSTLVSASGFPLTSTTNTSATVSGLSANTSYTVVAYGKKTVGSKTYLSTGLSTTVTTLNSGLVPTFGTNVRNIGGFSGSITNYSASYTWSISTSAGSVTWGTASGGNRPFTVTGLTAGQLAIVTVSTSGRSGYASASATTAAYSVEQPDAPTIGTATAATIDATYAYVSFTAPSYNGGAAITSYTATSSPGGLTGTLSQSGSGTITVTGLSQNTNYTFTVTATNGAGTSVASSASNTIKTYIRIPDYTGLSKSTAESAITNSTAGGNATGFTYSYGSVFVTTNPALDNTVYSQTPYYGQSGSYVVSYGQNFVLRLYSYLVSPSGGSASISGTATQGNILTLAKTDASGSPSPTASWVWQRNDGGQSGGTYVTQQTGGTTYTLGGYDANYSIKAIVTWTNSQGTQVVTTNVIGPITPIYWNITYSANGGTGAPATTSIIQGLFGNISSTTPTRSGYTFNGWKTAGGTSYAAGDAVNPTSDIALIAQWTLNTYYYSIGFSNNGGTGTMTSLSGTAASVTLTTNTFTRTNYTFGGWNTASDGTGTNYADGATISLSSTTTITLYAKWNSIIPGAPTITSSSATASSITLNFTPGANSTSTRAYADGDLDGSTSGTSYTFFFSFPNTAYSLNLFGYNGINQSATSAGGIYYTDKGTALTPTFGTNTSSSLAFTGSVTNYDTNYTWSISTSAGSVTWGTASGGSRPFTVTGLNAGQSATVTVGTSRTDYYSGSNTTTGSANAPVTQYTVTWNANGGTVSPSSSVVNAGSAVTAPTPERTGYSFNGWYNTPTLDYIYGPIAGGASWTPPSTITMYARWSLVTAPSAPTGVGLTGSGVVSWTASTGSPTSYEIEFFTASNGTGSNAAPTTATGYTVTGISGSPYQLVSPYGGTNATWARVRVRARNAGGASSYSAWVPSATTYT